MNPLDSHPFSFIVLAFPTGWSFISGVSNESQTYGIFGIGVDENAPAAFKGLQHLLTVPSIGLYDFDANFRKFPRFLRLWIASYAADVESCVL